MRHYEAMYIVDPNIADEEVDPVIEKYSKVVTESGGELTLAARWEKGRRQLAYPVGKFSEGTYVQMLFTGNAEVPHELERIFGISEDVFRHLVMRTDETEE